MRGEGKERGREGRIGEIGRERERRRNRREMGARQVAGGRKIGRKGEDKKNR